MAAYPALRPATAEDTPPLVRPIALNAHNLTSIMESPEQQRQAQMTDDILCTVIGWMERSTVRPKWEEVAPSSEYIKACWAQRDSLQLINGVLHHMWETPSGDATLSQLVVSASLREKVLQELHGSVTAEHLRIAKTYGRVQQRYYWVKC